MQPPRFGEEQLPIGADGLLTIQDIVQRRNTCPFRLLLAAAARPGVAIMSRFTVGLLALLSYSGLVQAQEVSPKDFAYGQLAIPARDAAAYRFALPLNVYQNTAREDLRDLRVFNADGVVVPFSLSRPVAQSLVRQTFIALPIFPLPEGARIMIDGVHLTIKSAGSAVNLQTQNGTPVTVPVRQYLLDGRGLDATLSALQLGWPDGAAEYTGRLGIEASDDLATWRSVVVRHPSPTYMPMAKPWLRSALNLHPPRRNSGASPGSDWRRALK